MASRPIVDPKGHIVFLEPPIARALFSSTKFAWLWLIIRLYVGYQWIHAAWGKISGGTWATGEGLRGYWTNAVSIPESGRPAISFDWYRGFLQFMLDNGWYTWFADLIMYGEFMVGLALILGAFTGIVAVLGGFMNWNFIMAGSASTNGLLLVLAIFIVLAWKVAGWYGFDRWLLPMIGVPWKWSSHVDRPVTEPARA